MKTFFFICYLTLWLPIGAHADDATISVKAEVSKASLTIGERVEYKITITHDPSIEIVGKAVPPPSDTFEIKEAHDFYEKQGKEIVEGRRFVLTLYDLGEFILDPVTVHYRTAKGEEKSIETNRLYLTVRSVDSSGKPKTDIRGAKGVLHMPREWLWFWISLVLILFLGGGAYFWWRWKHRMRLGDVSGEPALSPEDEALVKLSRLFDSDLIRRGKLKEYFFELSEILRRYFERRYEILAIESTTSEILRDLQQKEVAGSLLSKIQQVMDAADLVKFAKWKPAAPEIVRVNQTSKTIIEEARPKVQSTEQIISPAPHGV